MELFKLFGSVMVDNKKANDSIQKTDSLAGKLGKSLGSGVQTAAKWGAGLVAGATAGGAALLGMATNAASTGDRIDKMSQKMSLSRKGFQEWEYVLSQNGMEIESLRGGMKKLTKGLDDAKNGSKSATEAFKRIGLSVDNIKNLNPEQAFEATVKALQNMPEGAEKAALANELLGKSGAELMPLLNGSAKSVEELKRKARDMGLVLSDDAVNASAKFTDTMDNVKRTLGAVAAKVGVSVMPIIQQFLDWVLANMPTIQSVMTTVFNVIQKVVTTAANIFKDHLLPIIQSVVSFFQNNWGTISGIVSTVFEVVTTIVNGFILFLNQILIPAINEIVAFIGQAWSLISEIISGVMEIIKSVISAWVSVVQSLWQQFGSYIIEYTQNAWDTIKGVVESVINVIKGIIQVVTSAIKGDWQGVWDGIKTIVTNIWNTMKAYIEGAINAIRIIIEGVWNGIKSLTSSVWDGIKSVISSVVDSIRNSVSNTFTSLKTTVETIWDGIKTAISTPINAAYNVVKRVIDKIKGVFNFKFKWPHIPLPHFSIKGSANPLKWLSEGVPRLSVDWYAEGGIFDKPTIFNTSYGMKGVGEKGPEAVTPISKLQDMIDWNTGKDTQLLVKILELLEALLMKDTNIILDGKKVSKGLAPALNKEFRLISERG